MKLVFATHNPHKLAEVQSMLPENMNILGLNDIGCEEDIPETQLTLQGNALEKARFVRKHYCCYCFSDDTGLEIEALGGKPGVLSARYAGDSRDSLSNMDKILKEMEGIENRKARFRTVIALILENEELLFEGIAEGKIISEKRGIEGFGYDPIFVPTGYEQTFAEMPLKEKNRISHRYKAFNMLSEYLMSLNYF